MRDIVVAPRFADPISWSASGTAKAAAVEAGASGASSEAVADAADVESSDVAADVESSDVAASEAVQSSDVAYSEAVEADVESSDVEAEAEAVDRGAGAAAAGSTATVKARGITISSQALEDCSDITLLRVTQTCGQNSDWWTPAQWIRARYAGGIHIFGRNITVDTCHLHNAAGVYRTSTTTRTRPP